MNVEMRKTAQGTEYWDTKEKKIRFVPAGKEPGFEVTKEPKSMLPEKESKQEDNETDIDLDSMNADQLKGFAKQNDIEVPGNMKKEETIRAHILESLNEADE
ncbi:hypothetical protein [Bacillus sp. KH172YL63]|uniref:hypothetical protein n=1 Tax=Bacillus sp. KH172YL63 TaxID=2709784 RepID=UPI0013E4AC15|nr:hypothetical protein [Bacillus sp. KH172YL63]BCB04753.1 hypothetical protein KH172YL63_28860 [Bacillus sp. KH172YL63]